MSCQVGFGDRTLDLTVDQARELLDRAERDGAVTITGFYFDCLVGISGDVMLADGDRLGRQPLPTPSQ